jgi:protoporphyrinogen IX oxidase
MDNMLAMITGFLTDWYLVVKALHVISVIAWMAALFYLPRLYVYHSEQVQSGSRTDMMFQTMERRLLKAIMNPAMIGTWIFGLALVLTPGIVDWSQLWPWVKAGCVLVMSGFHGWLAARRKNFAAGTNTRSGRTYRIMNEVPTILMVVIVFAVITRF